MITRNTSFYTVIFTVILIFPFTSFSSITDIQAKDIPEGIFGYKETVGEKISPFNWEAQETKDGVVIKVFENLKSFHNFCLEDGSTVKWTIEEQEKYDIIAERKGNTLHIQGTLFGETVDENITIDERPWYQPLSYSLGNFLNSDKTDTSFWVIRADTIEVLALTAKKKGEETVMVGETPVLAQKIEIRAEGFKSKFWHATYWYRKSDNLFVRYQSVHGLPGTDETIVELVKSPSGHLDS